jgi:hypothetical protein
MAAKKRPDSAPVETERLTAKIISSSRSYYISQSDGSVGDEGLLQISGEIFSASEKHRNHIGCPIAITLAGARSFGEQEEGQGRPFKVMMNLRKNQRSLMAYLPADAFWALPQLIADEPDPVVDVTFQRLTRGSWALLSVFVGSAEDATALPY